ncbi:hypothetical protein K3728_14675 [Rhodobacteraceae bacterium M385]|nr:hypothetical protein K3728_14675 [Rhodobacteraceae bacterium M385]
MRFVALACVALAGCASAPNDVSPGQQTLDQQGLNARQAGLNGQISSEVIQPASTGVGIEAGATGDVTFLDPNNLTAIAEGAIAESEAGASGGVFDNIQPQQANDILPPPLLARVAAFALRTTHQPGERQWRRNPFRTDGQDFCLEFETRDEAQDRFLADGGPERDPNGMDPDGDGFVCGFDPSALRASANAPVETFDTLPSIDG